MDHNRTDALREADRETPAPEKPVYGEKLIGLLKAEIAYHDAQLSTTPHLSRIRHAEAALLALLEEKDRPEPSEEGLCPRS